MAKVLIFISQWPLAKIQNFKAIKSKIWVQTEHSNFNFSATFCPVPWRRDEGRGTTAYAAPPLKLRRHAVRLRRLKGTKEEGRGKKDEGRRILVPWIIDRHFFTISLFHFPTSFQDLHYLWNGAIDHIKGANLDVVFCKGAVAIDIPLDDLCECSAAFTSVAHFEDGTGQVAGGDAVLFEKAR